MSSVAERPLLDGSRNGGIAARRAVVRWAWRMFRREWRRQLLVVLLLAVAVAAAIGSITVAHNAVRADDGEFGSASQILTFDASDPQKLAAGLAGARRAFGTIDVVGHRTVSVPGSVETVDYRAQAPGGVYGRDLLTLRRGRYPSTPLEVAVTDGVAEVLRLELGSALALDGRRRVVVGIVENPSKLSDEFALISPSSGNADHVDVLVGASSDSTETASFFQALDDGARFRWAFAGSKTRGSDVAGAEETLAIFWVATVFLLLASLVATSGFAIVAQRRVRQLGMLAAVGATEKHLRLVLLTNGAVVGAIAAAIGTIGGLALWAAVAPTLEPVVDHRIDPFVLPWGLIALAVVLAVLGAAAAAWWPGRTVARLPILLALTGRPPSPGPARRSAIAAAALIAVGIGCLVASRRDRPALIVVGLVGTIVGGLLLAPPAIRILSAVAARAPVAVRLALRDLARHQTRSGAALAAVTLALGIAAAVVVTASAEEAKRSREPATLNDRQIRLYLGPPNARQAIPADAGARADQVTPSVRRLGDMLGSATVIALSKAVAPGVATGIMDGLRVVPTVEFFERSASARRQYTAHSQLYVATPSVLRYVGVAPATVDSGTDYLVDRSVTTERLAVPGMRGPGGQLAVTNVQRIDVGRHLFGGDTARQPANFVTLGGLRRHGWKQIPAGWLVESSRPLTTDQIADAREIAAASGLTMEVRRRSHPPTEVMAIATAAGAILALAILALTVGLIRGESAGDLRTLTAAGATSRIRRTLTAATAGALAFLGSLLGVGGAYLVLVAAYYDDLGHLRDVPVLYLVVAIVGVPLCATAAGWLAAGREPPAIARPVIL